MKAINMTEHLERGSHKYSSFSHGASTNRSQNHSEQGLWPTLTNKTGVTVPAWDKLKKENGNTDLDWSIVNTTSVKNMNTNLTTTQEDHWKSMKARGMTMMIVILLVMKMKWLRNIFQMRAQDILA